MKSLEELTGLYPVSKTLRFELRPYLNGNQTIDEFWNQYLNSALYINDERRWNARNTTKRVFDEFHKLLISQALKDFVPQKVSWIELYNLYKTRNNDSFSKAQEIIRKEIASALSSCAYYKYVKSYSKLIEAVVAEKDKESFVDEIVKRVALALDKDSNDVIEDVKYFNGFATGYFSNYKDNRDNMYKEGDDSTSIANRIVNENFPKFADNILVYNRLKENCPVELSEIEQKLADRTSAKSFDEIFTPEAFSDFITQEGIDIYNLLIGGDPNSNLEGINKIGNEFIQKNPSSKLRIKDLMMTKLYKQILSDRVRLAFIPEQFKSGREGEIELLEAVKSYFDCLPQLLAKYSKIVAQLRTDDTNLAKIYVVGKNLTKLSLLLYGDWEVLGKQLKENLVLGNSARAKAEKRMDVSEWIEKRSFPLSEIINASKNIMAPNATEVLDLIIGLRYKKVHRDDVVEVDLLKALNESYAIHFMPIMQNVLDGGSISNNDEAKASMKIFMDAMMDILHVVELLRLGKKSATLNKDSFYVDYDNLFEHSTDIDVVFSDLIALYNKVRSFLTRKVGDEGKMLLKFDCGTLANGWKDCKIVRKGNNFYLLLIRNKLTRDENKRLYENSTCHILKYAQQKTDFKNLIRLFVSSRGEELAPAVSKYHLPIETILDDYRVMKNMTKAEKQKYKLAHSDYDLRLIEYFKYGLLKHKDFEPFRNVLRDSWRDSSSYSSANEFCSHIQEHCYNLSYEDADFEYMNSLAIERKVLIFQIYNKDFADATSGTPNMHTLYWNYLFSEENLKNAVFKLSSQEVKLFFRRKQDGKSVTHNKGSILVNKRFADGKPIPADLYREYYRYYNQENVTLTEEAQKHLPNVVAKKARFDIKKDRRYFQHHFEIHIPITLNFKNKGIKTAAFNNFMLEYFRNHKEDINIIGIDRGERNLIYVSVINQRGENIIPPKSYNVIDTVSYDGVVRQFHYLEKLQQTEKNKADAYQHWGKIENIKELKSGLMAQVVHEISKLVVEHNAIVVLEDLNYGFKRGRFNVERQVYQIFEKRLIEKLNYLAFKTNAPSQKFGNVWNALQLTAPFTSFKDLGKQSGWLFYVPAAYTSKIDPQTGFANLFDIKKAETDPKRFFGLFDEISYSEGKLCFKFDYRKFDVVQTDFQNNWVLTSHGNRIYRTRIPNTNHYDSVSKDLSDEFVAVLEKYGIVKENLSVETIQEVDNKSFFKEFFFQFKMLLQMRNSNKEHDYIVSPVKSPSPFNTSCSNRLGIQDADANGAYNIALKGLYLVHNDFPMEDNRLIRISHSEWFAFIQQKPYLK